MAVFLSPSTPVGCQHNGNGQSRIAGLPIEHIQSEFVCLFLNGYDFKNLGLARKLYGRGSGGQLDTAERLGGHTLGYGRAVGGELFHLHGQRFTRRTMVHQQRIGRHAGFHTEGDGAVIAIACAQLSVEEIESLLHFVGLQVEAQMFDTERIHLERTARSVSGTGRF